MKTTDPLPALRVQLRALWCALLVFVCVAAAARVRPLQIHDDGTPDKDVSLSSAHWTGTLDAAKIGSGHLSPARLPVGIVTDADADATTKVHGFINTSASYQGDGSLNFHGGHLDLSGGIDGNGGSVTTSNNGGSINTSDTGGSINTSSGGGSIDTSSGGSIITNGGGTINTSYGGYISTNDDGGSIDTSLSGGGIYTIGGGTINTSYGGYVATANSGGCIDTAGGGGSMFTRPVAFADRFGFPQEGTFQPFTDSTTNTWGATITGGGSHHVLGYFNGTNWSVLAK